MVNQFQCQSGASFMFQMLFIIFFSAVGFNCLISAHHTESILKYVLFNGVIQNVLVNYNSPNLYITEVNYPSCLPMDPKASMHVDTSQRALSHVE